MIPDCVADRRPCSLAAVGDGPAPPARPAAGLTATHLLMGTSTADVGRNAPLSPIANHGGLPGSGRGASVLTIGRGCRSPHPWIRSLTSALAARAGGPTRPSSWHRSSWPSGCGSSSTRCRAASSGSGRRNADPVSQSVTPSVGCAACSAHAKVNPHPCPDHHHRATSAWRRFVTRDLAVEPARSFDR